MLLELHLVRTFVAILEAGSFFGAAASLGLSQPTVSQHVRRLEQLTGERLFQRDTHSVALTPNGAVLERFAREMVALENQAEAYYAGCHGADTNTAWNFGGSGRHSPPIHTA